MNKMKKCKYCHIEDCINCDADIPMDCCCSHNERDSQTAKLLLTVGIGMFIFGLLIGFAFWGM